MRRPYVLAQKERNRRQAFYEEDKSGGHLNISLLARVSEEKIYKPIFRNGLATPCSRGAKN